MSLFYRNICMYECMYECMYVCDGLHELLVCYISAISVPSFGEQSDHYAQ